MRLYVVFVYSLESLIHFQVDMLLNIQKHYSYNHFLYVSYKGWAAGQLSDIYSLTVVGLWLAPCLSWQPLAPNCWMATFSVYFQLEVLVFGPHKWEEPWPLLGLSLYPLHLAGRGGGIIWPLSGGWWGQERSFCIQDKCQIPRDG